jgi:hypothetical protein
VNGEDVVDEVNMKVVTIRAEVAVLAEGANANADGLCVLNLVELHEHIYLVVTSIAYIEKAKMFCTPIDNRDKEEMMKLLQMMVTYIFIKMWMES